MRAKLPIRPAVALAALALVAACGDGPASSATGPGPAVATALASPDSAAADASTSPSPTSPASSDSASSDSASSDSASSDSASSDPAPITVPITVPIAASAPAKARLVVNMPGYDSPGARVPLILTLLNAPPDLAPEALTAVATAGAQVVECGPSWRNPSLDSLSRQCQVLGPTTLATSTLTATARWRTAAGENQTVRADPFVYRTKGPRSTPTTAAEAARISSCGNTSEYVWLTFDDYLPSLATAQAMVEVLGRNEARGRFLLNRVAPAVRRVLESNGHVVTNHTRDHVALSGLSDAAIREQVRGGPATTPGEQPMLRPPYGAGSWSQRVVRAVESTDHLQCRWTVDTADYSGRSAQRMAGGVRWGDAYTAPVAAGGVILMHANHFTPEKLQAVVDAVRVRGLVPEPIPEGRTR